MEKKTENQNKMGVLPEGKLLLSMSVPLVISMLLQAVYNLVDSIFVSRVGEDALTAVSLSFPIQMLMISVAVGTGVGMNSLISRRLGEGRLDEANAAANNGAFLLLLSALAFMLFGAFGVKPFFRAFTDSPVIYEMGVSYLSICSIFCVGVFMQVCCERLLQAQGQTVATMAMQLVGAIINIIFDPILIFGLFGFPKLGVAGAAIATVLGQWIAMLCSFLLLFIKKYPVSLRPRGFRPSRESIRDIYQVGFPSIIMQSVGTVMNLAMNALIIAYSTTAVALFGVYFKIQSLVFMPVFGLTSAAMSIMAFNYGARNRARLVRTWKLTLAAAVSVMTLGLLCFQLFPGAILALFDASQEMLRIGVPALRTLSPCFIVAAFCIANSTLFQAIGRGFYSMLLSLVRQLVVLVPAAYILSAVFHDLLAVWFAFPIAEVVALTMSFLMLRNVFDTQIRTLELPLSA